MGRVEVDNFIKAKCLPSDNPPDNPLQATLSWNLGTPGAYNSYNLRVDKDPVSWNGSCSPPNVGDTCSNGLTSTTSTFAGVSNSSYSWWLSATGPNGTTLPNASITGPQFTCSASSGPTITSLQIGNIDSHGFIGTSKTSGLQYGPEGGMGWYNPMTVTLNATKGAGDIKLYAIAFYDKNQGGTSIQSALTSLTAIEGQIDVDPTRGFLLAYAAQNCLNQTGNCLVDNKGTGFTAGKYYAYVKGSGWVDISIYDTASTGFPVLNNSGQTIYRVYAGSTQANWRVLYYKDFGGKNMYTPGFVIDSNNLSSFQSDLIPL